MGATLKSEGTGLVWTACECAGKSGRVTLFALIKAGVSSQPWNLLLLLYIALLTTTVHGNGKFSFFVFFFSSWRARGAVVYVWACKRTLYSYSILPTLYTLYTVWTTFHVYLPYTNVKLLFYVLLVPKIMFSLSLFFWSRLCMRSVLFFLRS